MGVKMNWNHGKMEVSMRKERINAVNWYNDQIYLYKLVNTVNVLLCNVALINLRYWVESAAGDKQKYISHKKRCPFAK